MELTEKEVGQLAVGKKASMVINYLDPLVEEQKDSIVTQMKHMYREGNYTESTLASATAQLCALDDLKNRIISKIKKADKLSRRIDRE